MILMRNIVKKEKVQFDENFSGQTAENIVKYSLRLRRGLYGTSKENRTGII